MTLPLLPAAGFLPVSLLDDVFDSLEHGEPLCCQARPGGGGEALFGELQARMAATRRVVRIPLADCKDMLDVVQVFSQAIQQPRTRPLCGTGRDWREVLTELLGLLTGQPDEAQGVCLLFDGLTSFLQAWQGGLCAGQDSARRMDLRVFFDMLARAASPRLAVVILATPGISTLLKCHRVEDVLTPFNELAINVPQAEVADTRSDPAAAAAWARERAAALGLALAPEAAEHAVALAGAAYPEHLALLLEQAARQARQQNANVADAAFLDEVVATRLLGPFEHLRWRRQEDALYAGLDALFAPLLLELLRRAAGDGVTVEEAFKLAGIGSPYIQTGGSMPVHLLRQHLEWMEQEGFLERRADRYVMPDSLFGRWLVGIHRPCKHVEPEPRQAQEATGGDSAL
ncbi:hypothetical protein [Megalodesulfovibrio paquesii]